MVVRSRSWILLSLSVAACGRIGFEARLDAAPTLEMVSELNEGPYNDDPALRGDELEIVWTRVNGECDTWTARRSSRSEPWTAPAVTSISMPGLCEATPLLSHDGLTLWFGAYSTILETKRSTLTSPWGPTTQLPIGGGNITTAPTITADERLMFFVSDRLGDEDLFVTTRALVTDPWSTPSPVSELNRVGLLDRSPHVSGDGNSLWFVSDRNGSSHDIYVATRAWRTEPFGAPVPIDAINTAAVEDDPWVSDDGTRIYFVRDGAIWLWSR